MSAREYRDLLLSRPFQPFRIVMTSGKSYEVRHPEMAWVWGNDMYVGIGQGSANSPETPAETVICPLFHISSFERLAVPAA